MERSLNRSNTLEIDKASTYSRQLTPSGIFNFTEVNLAALDKAEVSMIVDKSNVSFKAILKRPRSSSSVATLPNQLHKPKIHWANFLKRKP